MSSRFAVSRDGIRLAYEAIGTGPPLVLISGRGGDRHLWDDIRYDFSGEYRVITFDHRGTGESDKPETPPYSIRGFARDVIAILDALSIARAHVYGASMGGAVAQMLAIDHPGRVAGLVLGCSTPGTAHGIRRSAEADAVMANPASDPEQYFWSLLDFLVTPQWAAANATTVEGWRRHFHEDQTPQYASRLHSLASAGHDAWNALPAISAPTLVIHGADDRIAPPANAHLLAERIPNAELHIIPGSRHRYLIEARAEASHVVKEFLSRHPL